MIGICLLFGGYWFCVYLEFVAYDNTEMFENRNWNHVDSVWLALNRFFVARHFDKPMAMCHSNHLKIITGSNCFSFIHVGGFLSYLVLDKQFSSFFVVVIK